MSASNNEHIHKAIEVLTRGLFVFIEREMKAEYGEQWQEAALASLPPHLRLAKAKKGKRLTLTWDASLLFAVLWNQWNRVFEKTLDRAARSLVSELQVVRNRWAHQDSFDTANTQRALESMQRLLRAIDAPEAADLDLQVQELVRLRYEEQTRGEAQLAEETLTEGTSDVLSPQPQHEPSNQAAETPAKRRPALDREKNTFLGLPLSKPRRAPATNYQLAGFTGDPHQDEMCKVFSAAADSLIVETILEGTTDTKILKSDLTDYLHNTLKRKFTYKEIAEIMISILYCLRGDSGAWGLPLPDLNSLYKQMVLMATLVEGWSEFIDFDYLPSVGRKPARLKVRISINYEIEGEPGHREWWTAAKHRKESAPEPIRPWLHPDFDRLIHVMNQLDDSQGTWMHPDFDRLIHDPCLDFEKLIAWFWLNRGFNHWPVLDAVYQMEGTIKDIKTRLYPDFDHLIHGFREWIVRRLSTLYPEFQRVSAYVDISVSGKEAAEIWYWAQSLPGWGKEYWEHPLSFSSFEEEEETS